MGVCSCNAPSLGCISDLSSSTSTGSNATSVWIAQVAISGDVAGRDAEIATGFPVNTCTTAEGEVVSARCTGVGEEIHRHVRRIGAWPNRQHVIHTDNGTTNNGELTNR